MKLIQSLKDNGARLRPLMTILVPAICVLIILVMANGFDEIVRQPVDGLVQVPVELVPNMAMMPCSAAGKGELIAAKVVWAYSSAMLLALCVITIAASLLSAVWSIGLRRIPYKPLVDRLPIGLLVLGVSFLLRFWTINPTTNFTFRLMSATGVDKESIGGYWAQIIPLGHIETVVGKYESLIYNLVFIACVTIVLTVCSIHIPSVARNKNSPLDVQQETECLNRQMQGLRTAVYLAMLVLVLSVFQLSSLHSWMVTRVAVAAEVQHQKLQTVARAAKDKALGDTAVLKALVAQAPGTRSTSLIKSTNEAVESFRKALLNSDEKTVRMDQETAGDRASALEVLLGDQEEAKTKQVEAAARVAVASFRLAVDKQRKVPPGDAEEIRVDAAKGVEHLTKALLNSEAAVWTLILAAMYFPASIFLGQEARKLARRVHRPSAETVPAGKDLVAKELEWLKARGLVSDPLAMVPRFAAILAPLLAGIASQLLLPGLSLLQ